MIDRDKSLLCLICAFVRPFRITMLFQTNHMTAEFINGKEFSAFTVSLCKHVDKQQWMGHDCDLIAKQPYICMANAGRRLSYIRFERDPDPNL